MFCMFFSLKERKVTSDRDWFAHPVAHSVKAKPLNAMMFFLHQCHVNSYCNDYYALLLVTSNTAHVTCSSG